MKISKKDALMWFEFFAALPEEEELMPHQQEIALAALAQIETAVNKRREAMASRIEGLQSLSGRTYFVGDRAKFPPVMWGMKSAFPGAARPACWARG